MKKLLFFVSLVIIAMTANQISAKTYKDSLCNGSTISIGAKSMLNGCSYYWNGKYSETKSIEVSPTTTNTTYILSVLDCNLSLIDRDTFYLKVLSTPNVFITSTPSQIICLGKTVTLTATGESENKYIWSTGQTNPITTFSPNATTTYTVTATGTNGCATIAKTVIIVNPLPKAEIIITSL
ncbi:MAG: hypothetical protein WC872_02555, partial [Candidatus Absconditabacterales bacterium]